MFGHPVRLVPLVPLLSVVTQDVTVAVDEDDDQVEEVEDEVERRVHHHDGFARPETPTLAFSVNHTGGRETNGDVDGSRSDPGEYHRGVDHPRTIILPPCVVLGQGVIRGKHGG